MDHKTNRGANLKGLAQAFWLYLVIDRRMWGLLPLTAILTWRYTVALLKWRELKRS